jgi:predicted dehydrogenase
MIRVAIVGLGWWGKTIAGLLKNSSVLRAVAAVEPAEAAGRAFCAEHGLRFEASLAQALDRDDIDAVVLTTPHRLHETQIEQAAAAGKHVFCEKPLALTAASAARSIAACQRHGVVLGVGHERRFEPPMLLIRQLLESGELGTLMQIEGNFSHDKFMALPADNWRLSRAEAALGPMTATGIHLLDMACSLGGGATRAYATCSNSVSGFGSGDSMACHLTLRTGAVATITAMLATPFFSRFAVFGSKGWMELRDRSHVEAPTGWIVTRSAGNDQPVVTQVPPATPVLDNLEHFARAIERGQAQGHWQGQAAYPIPLQEMFATAAAFEATFASTLQGVAVDVTPTPDKFLT